VIWQKLDFLFLLRGLFGLRGLRLGQALLEFVHASGGVHELLCAGVKRVAGVANADDDGGFGGTRLDHVAAGAPDFRVRIFWMNVRLHKRDDKTIMISLDDKTEFCKPTSSSQIPEKCFLNSFAIFSLASDGKKSNV
jgi:hypothetical protein